MEDQCVRNRFSIACFLNINMAKPNPIVTVNKNVEEAIIKPKAAIETQNSTIV